MPDPDKTPEHDDVPDLDAVHPAPDNEGGDSPELPPQNQGETLEQYVQRVVQAALATGQPAEPQGPHGEGVGPRRPRVDHAPTNSDEAAELGKAFAEYRAEVAALRRELAAHRPRTVQVAQTRETPEERQEARLALIADHSHYCPGCGALGKYAQKCHGPASAGHPPLEMVETGELGGDPEKHTRAPSTDPDQPDLVAA